MYNLQIRALIKEPLFVDGATIMRLMVISSECTDMRKGDLPRRRLTSEIRFTFQNNVNTSQGRAVAFRSSTRESNTALFIMEAVCP